MPMSNIAQLSCHILIVKWTKDLVINLYFTSSRVGFNRFEATTINTDWSGNNFLSSTVIFGPRSATFGLSVGDKILTSA